MLPPDTHPAAAAAVQAQIKLTPGEHSRLLKQWNLCCKRVAQANIKCSRWTAVLKREQQRAAAAAAAAAAGAAAGGVEAKFVSSAGGMEASMEGLSCSTGSPAADTPVQNAAAAAAAAAVAADAAVQAAAEQLWPQGSSWEAAGPAHMPGGTPPVHGPDSTSQGPGGSIAAEVGGLGDDRGMAAAAGSSLSVSSAPHHNFTAVSGCANRYGWDALNSSGALCLHRFLVCTAGHWIPCGSPFSPAPAPTPPPFLLCISCPGCVALPLPSPALTFNAGLTPSAKPPSQLQHRLQPQHLAARLCAGR